jgi:glycosyltransferase involved in cell wall biosynthesis
MNVAIAVKEFPPDVIGGTETQTKRMAGELAARGHDVTVFTKRYDRSHEDDDIEYEVRRVWNLEWSPFLSTLTFLVAALFAVVRRADEFDCLQCMMLYPIGFLGYVMNLLTGLPYFAWVRGGDYYLMRDVRWKRWMMRAVLTDTLVLTQAADIRTDIRADFDSVDSNVEVLGNGVSIPDERAPCSDRTVLYLGRLAPKKGLEYLIEAAAELDGPYELVVVGDGERRDDLEALAERLNVSVTFEGFVDPDAVGDYYRSADVFVLPSIEGEGTPNAMLEAMAWGLPVVGTDSGGVGETLRDGETGYLVPMRDSSALADAVQTLLDDGERRREMGEAARRYASEHHSWDSLAESLEQIYASRPADGGCHIDRLR